MNSNRYVTIPVKQSLPVHPLTHVQMSGAVHCLLLPHGGLQIAIWLEDINDDFTWKCNHTC